MRLFNLASFVLIILHHTAAYADQDELMACFETAGKYYQVDPALLLSIAKVESNFDPLAHNAANGDGSEDYGVMQINSQHLPRLSQFNLTKEMLLNDPCSNIHVGAWILAENISLVGANWLAVGAYNAGFTKSPGHDRARAIYVGKVRAALSNFKEREND